MKKLILLLIGVVAFAEAVDSDGDGLADDYEINYYYIVDEISASSLGNFGSVVDISYDGKTLIVGSPQYQISVNQEISNSYNPYVKVYREIDGSWAQLGQTLTKESSKFMFGDVAMISGDGNKILVGGASNNGTNYLQVYEFSSSQWVQVGEDISHFVLEGNTIGADISYNGETVILGLRGNDVSYAQTWDFVDNDWELAGMITMPNGDGAYDEARSVSISSNANTIAMGGVGYLASERGRVGVFDRVYTGVSAQNYDWILRGNIITNDIEYHQDVFGEDISLSADGNQIAIGAWQDEGGGILRQGSASVYEYTNNVWRKVGSTIYGEKIQHYSGKVSLSGDGNVLINGYPASNPNVDVYAKYFKRVGDNWTQFGDNIYANSEHYNRNYRIVATDYDGDVFAVASPLDSTDNGTGRVRVYKTTYITDPNDADSDDDGLSDGDEVNTYATDPNDADSDDDGLSDGDEVNIHGTDPNNMDTDGDGVTDGDEVSNGTDPTVAYTPTNEYHLIEHELTWDQCLAYARHYGGELAAITSQGEEAYVTSWLDSQIGEQDSEVFLGGSDADVEDTWTWSSGETWDYENWYVGEPNNQNGDEDYLQLTHNSVINWDWKWNDFDGNGADATYYMLIEAVPPLNHLVNPVHWDNAVWTEYGQTFEATAPSMHGVSFHMRNNNDAPGPFEVAVYELPDSENPIKSHEFSSDGSGLDGLIEVVFDSPVLTTVGSNYLFTIKRSTTDTYDIGLYSMSDSYLDGDIAVRLNDGTMVFNESKRDLSFKINTTSIPTGGVIRASTDSDGDRLADIAEIQTYGTYPNDSDSDDDGLMDGDEVALSTYDWIEVPDQANWDWHYARDDAVARGGHLVTINSSNEWDIVHNLITNNYPIATVPFTEEASIIWLGGTDENVEGQWEWVTGEPWTVEFWSPELDGSPGPNNYGYGSSPANYLSLNWHSVETFNAYDNWEDAGSYPNGWNFENKSMFYILETMSPNTDPNDADSDDDGLNDGDEVLASTYQIITGSYSWDQARLDALNRGGRLAVISNISELNQVMELLESEEDTLSDDRVWIGARKVDGQWTWLDDTPWSLGFITPFLDPDGGQKCVTLTTAENHENGVAGWPGYAWPWDSQFGGYSTSYILEIQGSATDASDSDSDDDGLSDGDEVNTYGTDPNDADSDDDGLSDGDEVNTHGTDPNNMDTDGDGITDSQELLPDYDLNWSQLGNIIKGEAPGDNVGRELKLSSDGTTVIVGSHASDLGGVNAGEVRIYRISNEGTWVKMGTSIVGAAGEYLGNESSIDISSNGNIIAVGTHKDAGRVRVYAYNNDTWVQRGQDIDGEYAQDECGSVCISGDGDLIAVGSMNPGAINDGDGNIRLFAWDEISQSWSLHSQLDGEGRFGTYFYLSNDGSTLAVKSDGGLNAQIYSWDGSSWGLKGTNFTQAVNEITLNNDGSVMAMQLSGGQHSVHRWLPSLGEWEQLGNPISSGLSSAGYPSLSSSGRIIGIGSYGSGDQTASVYHYNPIVADWVQLGSNIDDYEPGDYFGMGISVSGDGSRISVGAKYAEGVGHALIYEYPINITDPNDSDSDDDGLMDIDEVNTHGTDPNDADSDDDGLSDGDEITNGTDPTDSDSDDDGLSDGYEVMNTYELIIGSFDPNSAASDANNRGGYLATITSTQEWNYIQSLITTNITYWLGGNDVAAEGQWVWNNGEAWAVDFWGANQPDNGNGGSEPYLTAVHNNGQNSWNDTESFYSHSYLLEVNKLTTNPNDADSDGDGVGDGDEAANGTNPNIAESSGTVPINSWEQLGDIISNSGQPDGNAPHPQRISLSKDGNRFAVSDTSSGVSVYQLSNGSWIQVGQSISTGVYTAKVALSGDGSALICGVGNLDQASVYQFVDDSWSQVGATLIGSSGGYGSGVGISDDGGIIAVGDWLDDEAGENAGKVTIYQFVDGEWSQLGNSILGKYAGDQSARRALDLSSNGHRVAIGNYGSSVPNGSHSGNLRVYEYNINLGWYQLGDDISGVALDDRFSTDVALSEDGSIVAGGAYRNDPSGHVRVFEWNNTAWVQRGQTIVGEGTDDRFGFALSMSSSGSRIAVGGYWNDDNGQDAGHVRTFDYDGSSWVQIGDDIDGLAVNDQFGHAVSISGAGDTLAVSSVNGSGGVGNVQLFTGINSNDIDSDDDGLSDGDEVNTHGTDPNDADSDDDGLSDGDEITNGADPNDADSDDDGLDDGDEVNTHGTDPNDADSDDDGLSDRDEVLNSTYELVAGSYSWEEARDEAISRGGHLATITSSNEWNTVVELWSTVSPNIYWLGASDDEEEGVWKWITGEAWTVEFWDEINPNNAGDAEHYLTIERNNNEPYWNDAESWGVRSFVLEVTNSSFTSTNPNNADSDGDGLSDGDEFNSYGTDPNDIDSDNDGLTDGNEINTSSTNPNDFDSDNDGLSDGDEVNTHSTDPNDADSDDDGLSDGDEITNGTDPNVAEPTNEEYELTLHFNNASAGFFNESIKLSNTIGTGCRVELLWSSTNAANTTYGNESNLLSTITGAGVSDLSGLGYWNSSSLSAEDLPNESGYVWARVYNHVESYYVDLGEVDIASTLNSIDEDTALKIPNSTKSKRYYIMETDGTEVVALDSDGDGLSNEYEEANGLDPNDADSDDDGLSDGDEVLTHNSNPLSTDTDGDTFDDSFEVDYATLGFDINTDSIDVVNLIKDMNQRKPDLGGGGLTLEEAKSMMRDLRPGSQTIDVSNGTARIRMRLEESSDLMTNWSSRAEMMEVDIPATNNVQFFRFNME